MTVRHFSFSNIVNHFLYHTFLVRNTEAYLRISDVSTRYFIQQYYFVSLYTDIRNVYESLPTVHTINVNNNNYKKDVKITCAQLNLLVRGYYSKGTYNLAFCFVFDLNFFVRFSACDAYEILLRMDPSDILYLRLHFFCVLYNEITNIYDSSIEEF